MLFGESGSGKSNLLETLGLMRDCFAANKATYDKVLNDLMNCDEISKSVKSGIEGIKNGENTELRYYDQKGEDHLFFEVTDFECFENVHKKTKTFARRIRKHKRNKKLAGYDTIWTKKRGMNHLRKNDFSFIFQAHNLMPTFTASDNVMIAGFNNSRANEPITEQRAQANETLGRVCLSGRENCKAEDLSGGQKQRVAFARAMNAKFSVIFADEPTGNLDWQKSIEVMDYLTEVEASGHSALIVTHSIDLCIKYADRIFLLDTVALNKNNGGPNIAVKYENNIMGIIDDEKTIVRNEKGWSQNNGLMIDDEHLKVKLKEHLGDKKCQEKTS